MEWIKQSKPSECHYDCNGEKGEVDQGFKKTRTSSIQKIPPSRTDEDLRIDIKNESLSKLSREEIDDLMTQISSNIYKEWERAKLKSERKAHKIRRLHNF